jgi:hypothetical protein
MSEPFSVTDSIDVEPPCDTVGCERCLEFDEQHDSNCPNHPDFDPSNWCDACGARTPSQCHCGPIARNN